MEGLPISFALALLSLLLLIPPPVFAEALDERLAVLGRTEWAAEEFRRLESVRWSGSEKDPDAFRRTKGASRLDRKGLAVTLPLLVGVFSRLSLCVIPE